MNRALNRTQQIEAAFELKQIEAKLEVLERGKNYMKGNFYADYKEQLQRRQSELLTDLGITEEQFKEAPLVQYMVGETLELYEGVLTDL